jgi:transcriptional regulator with XRE-family HTH domain
MTIKKLEECSANKVKKMLEQEMTFAKALVSLRDLYGLTQADLSKKIGISKQNICDIEKERRFVSPYKASLIAKKLGHPESYFVKLAVQDYIKQNGLNYKVILKVA